MIKAVFFKKSGVFTGFSVTGHAGFAESGKDIVCASVSSAVQLTVNGITECAHIEAKVIVLENDVALTLPDGLNSQSAQLLLNAFYLQFTLLKEEFPQFITITVSEV